MRGTNQLKASYRLVICVRRPILTGPALSILSGHRHACFTRASQRSLHWKEVRRANFYLENHAIEHIFEKGIPTSGGPYLPWLAITLVYYFCLCPARLGLMAMYDDELPIRTESRRSVFGPAWLLHTSSFDLSASLSSILSSDSRTCAPLYARS